MQELPRNLSPRAKKSLLTATGDEVVRVLVQVAPIADDDALEQQIVEVGGTVGSRIGETRQLTVDLPARRLGELADLDGVVYVETGEPYSL